MSSPPIEQRVDRLLWEMTSVERRLGRIEDLEPEVMAARMKDLAEQVASLRKAFYTFAVSSVLAAFTFALSVFALLGSVR